MNSTIAPCNGSIIAFFNPSVSSDSAKDNFQAAHYHKDSETPEQHVLACPLFLLIIKH